MIRNLLISLVLVAMAVGLLGGCAGMVDTPQEREIRYAQITNLELRGFVDDWDYLWLYDRNNQMTYWHPRVGND